ncbi:hypothetical protein F2Q68_00011380 [Brassica cretica]|uniref:Uncharacterized protein n=1 Tax=Brassica cretica TaxID=69181 RepID=A0A8S9KRV0_BRACR|nr:hypothetical protein F2Q68_00011380 [Brassica cretica]
MDYPVHTLDVRSGVPVAVFFAFSLRSTMIGSFLQQSRSDRLLDLIPVKPSLQIAQVSLSFGYLWDGYRAKWCMLNRLGGYPYAPLRPETDSNCLARFPHAQGLVRPVQLCTRSSQQLVTTPSSSNQPNHRTL